MDVGCFACTYVYVHAKGPLSDFLLNVRFWYRSIAYSTLQSMFELLCATL